MVSLLPFTLWNPNPGAGRRQTKITDLILTPTIDTGLLIETSVAALNRIRKKTKQEDRTEQGALGRMSSWIQHHANSHQSQLAATAVLSGAAVAGAIFGYQALKRQEAVRELKDSIPEVNERHHADKVSCHGELAAVVA